MIVAGKTELSVFVNFRVERKRQLSKNIALNLLDYNW